MKLLALLLPILLPVLLASCGSSQMSELAAKDRIMLVRQTPPTLGHRRLIEQSASHPDLLTFLTKRGNPDFIAETSSDDRHYLVLYYLKSKRAYAARSWMGYQAIEFAGPYPITSEETELLAKLRDGAAPTISPGITSGRLLVP